MAKHSKKYQDALKQAPKAAVPLEEAVAFIKAHPGAKFDETVDVGLRLGADPTKGDQAVRGVVHLPHGTGKHVRVVVFAGGELADQAKAAGADEAGLDDLIERVKGGWVDFDVAVATPDAMKQVRTVARILGPRGLMPNPKTGTVTDDVVSAIKAAPAWTAPATSASPPASSASRPPSSWTTSAPSSRPSSTSAPPPPRASSSAAAPSAPPWASACASS